MFKFISNLFAWICSWVASLNKQKLKPFKTIKVNELPNKLESNAIYLVGENEFLWHAALLCPCQCGERIHTSLLTNDNPRWTLTEHPDQTISLHPSIWRTKGCKSHFFLQKGYIKWA